MSKIFKIGIWAVALSMFCGCGAGAVSGSSQSGMETPATSQHAVVQPSEAKPMIRVGALLGPTGLGMAELMEKNEQRETGNIYEFTLAGAPDEITGKIISGELDIAAVPTNLAAALYEKTEKKVNIIGVNTLGVLYMLQNQSVGAEDGDEEADLVESVADLKGKEILSSGQGATQEYVLNYLLQANDLIPGEDVTITYLSEHAELATQMLEGRVELALLPQPFVTNVMTKDEEVKQVLDITDEWKTITGTELAMGCIIVRSEFLEKNKQAVDLFLEEYAASAEYVNENVDEAAALSGKFEIIKEDVAKKALPQCNIVSMTGQEMKTAVSAYLDILYKADPKSVGGNLPDDEFYYTAQAA